MLTRGKLTRASCPFETPGSRGWPYTGNLVQLYHKAHLQLPRWRLPPMSPCRLHPRQSGKGLSGSGHSVSMERRSTGAMNVMGLLSASIKSGKSVAVTAMVLAPVSIKIRSPDANNAVGPPYAIMTSGRLSVVNATTSSVTSRNVPRMARNLQGLTVSSDICAASMLETAKPKPR